MTLIIPMCAFCAHMSTGLRCTAFPEGIPRAIRLEGTDHTRPYPGDRGIQFELAENVEPEFFRRAFPSKRGVRSGRI